MREENRKQLQVSFQLALEKVRDVQECRELFANLGADGVDTLIRARFYPMGHYESRPDVCRTAVAYTRVGGVAIRVCRNFWTLSDTEAAKVIIHEALHHAGLTERSQDARGLTSSAINDMVATRCRL